mgnify:FL=1
MTDLFSSLIRIFLGAFVSFANAGLYIAELYLSLQFVRLLKLESVFKKATPFAHFIIALIVASLAFGTINGYLGRYINALVGNAAPLSKIFTGIEAVGFGIGLYWLLKKKA